MAAGDSLFLALATSNHLLRISYKNIFCIYDLFLFNSSTFKMAADKSELLTNIRQLQTTIEYGDVDSAKKIVSRLATQRVLVEIQPKEDETPVSSLIKSVTT